MWSSLDRSLDGHVARLRRKIEPLSDEPRLVKKPRRSDIPARLASQVRQFFDGDPTSESEVLPGAAGRSGSLPARTIVLLIAVNDKQEILK